MVQDLRWLRDMSINRRIYESETFPGHTKRAVKQWAKCLRNLFDGDPEALKVIGTFIRFGHTGTRTPSGLSCTV
jgi:hypothetical protein